MELVLEDAAGFERAAVRTALWLGLSGLVLGVLGGEDLMARHAGLAGSAWGAKVLRGLELGFAALGAGLVLVRAAARRREARDRLEVLPSRWSVALAAVLGASGGILAARLLPALATEVVALLERLALTSWLPSQLEAGVALALCGVAFSLWMTLAGLSLHLSRGGLVEERLRAIRQQLGPELRPLAERAVAAWREAASLLREREVEGGPRLRGPLEAVALGALDLAARGAELQRAVTATQDREGAQRQAELAQLEATATDPVVRANLVRARESQEQLARRRGDIVRARERLWSRLHAEVSELERARLSLVVLAGAEGAKAAVELDLLGERLRAGAREAEGEAEADASGAGPGLLVR